MTIFGQKELRKLKQSLVKVVVDLGLVYPLPLGHFPAQQKIKCNLLLVTYYWRMCSSNQI